MTPLRKPHCRHHDHHNQRQRGEDVALQFGDLLQCPGRLVLRVVNGYLAGQFRTKFIDPGLHRRNRCDNVGVGALHDTQGNRRLTVDPGETGAVF